MYAQSIIEGRGRPQRANRLSARALALALALALTGCAEDFDVPRAGSPANAVGVSSIAGDPILGETLTAGVSDANGIGGRVAYQWAANGVAIEGATSQTYAITSNELGTTITVGAVYRDSYGYLETLTSAPTGVVFDAANTVGSISIFGIPALGRTLRADIIDGNGFTANTPAYQWVSDGVDVVGATAATYLLPASALGAQISVRAVYTDDSGYSESPTSSPIGPVTEAPTNVAGSVTMVGVTLVGTTLTANVADPNGLSGQISYQWAADGVDIVGATAQTYTPVAAQKRAVMRVSVSYTDDDGFAEGPLSAVATDVVYTAIATGEASLIAAATAAVDGDVIGLGSAAGGQDYTDMAEVVFAASTLLIKRTVGSTAVIRGKTCIVLSGSGTVVDGLAFDVLDWLSGGLCDANGDASVLISGNGVTLRNSQFRGEAFPRTLALATAYHYLALKGTNNIVERNLFQAKDMDGAGGAITIFANLTPLSDESHTVQYNLFKNLLGKSANPGNRSSTAYAIQLGRTAGLDAQGSGLTKIQHNRFDSVQSERRLIRVQSGSNTIEGNTIVSSLGLIALEDGYGNTVSRNLILSSGVDNDDGGISFAPLGHTVTGNYIDNLRTTSSERGGLLINPDPLSGDGNRAILATPGLVFTLTVARNTIVNAQRAIIFDDADCALAPATLDFDENFIISQSSSANGAGVNAVTDSDFLAAGCAIGAASDFDNNHFYAAMLSQSSMFNFNGGAADNTVGAEDGATFTMDANGLKMGSGADAGIGADTSMLNLITEAQVGPGSTWTAP